MGECCCFSSSLTVLALGRGGLDLCWCVPAWFFSVCGFICDFSALSFLRLSRGVIDFGHCFSCCCLCLFLSVLLYRVCSVFVCAVFAVCVMYFLGGLGGFEFIEYGACVSMWFGVVVYLILVELG